jgi:hypothetical protein
VRWIAGLAEWALLAASLFGIAVTTAMFLTDRLDGTPLAVAACASGGLGLAWYGVLTWRRSREQLRRYA